MLKWVLRAGVSIASLAAMTASASAEPISIALLTAVGISATATAVAVTTAVITTAASAALSYVGTVLMAKTTTSLSGVQTEVQFGGDVPRQIPFGTCRTPGQFIYFCGVGNKNKELHLVYALADWECDGLDHVYVDDVKTDLNGTSVVGTEHARYEVDGYGSNLIVKFFRGTMTQTADSELVAASSSRNTGLGAWTSDFRGAGVCYVSLKLTFDEDKFQGGIPRLEFQLRGAKLYDWRLDSTNGGSGSHRWNDPTTWAFSQNPIVMEYNFRRGFYRNGVKLMGMGVPSSNLLHDHYTAAANVCDENVSEGSVTVDRYRCSVIVNDDAEWRVPVNSFMDSCAGTMIEKGGLFGPVAGASQSTVATLTDLDLINGYDTSFSAKSPRSELANAVYGSYTNAAENWQSDSFPPVTNSTWETEDNGERLVRDLQLPQVNWAYQASRIAKIVANQGRKQARHVGVYGPKFSAIQAGDWVDWEHSQYGNYTMLIESKEEVAPLTWRLTMRETGADVYGDAATTPNDPGPIIVVIPPHTTIFTPTVTAVQLSGENGQIIPGILVTWTPPTDPSVKAVRIEYRQQGTTAVNPIIHYTPADGELLISDVMAGTTYEVRGRYQLEPDLTATWSSWIPVVTTALHVVINSRTAIDTQQFFDRFQSEVEGNEISNILDVLLKAQADEAIRVDYNTKLIQVQATQDEVNASASLQLSALATQDLAIAELLATVSAQAGNATANGAFKMEAVAAEGGATASIAAFVSADNGTTYERAGWRLDIFDEGGGNLAGRFVVEAQYFAIVENSAGTPSVPFSVIGTDTFIERVIIGDEILSDTYAEDADGKPIDGVRAGADGILKARSAVFLDAAIEGADFTGRPIKTESPILRNGVMEGQSFQRYAASSNINADGVAFPFDTDARFLTFEFHRSPDNCYGYCAAGGAVDKGGNSMVSTQRSYPVPHGQLLPTRMVIESGVNPDYIELRQDGSIQYIVLAGTGAISSTNDFGCNWMYDLEIDPENRRGLTDIVGALGVTRGAQPFVIPVGTTSMVISLLGAGGGYDDSNASVRGGPGGYVSFTLAVGDNEAVKAGDVLWFIIGEGGSPSRSGNSQGYGGAGQSNTSALRAQGGGGTFCFHKSTESRLNLIAVAGGGGAGEGTASGGPGGYDGGGGSYPAGGNGVTGDAMDRCTGVNWNYTGGQKRAGGGGGYEGGGHTAAEGGNNGGRGGTNYVNTTDYNITSVTDTSSAASSSTGYATTNNPPSAATTKFTGNLTCLGTRFTAGQGATNAMTVSERGGDGRVMIEL